MANPKKTEKQDSLWPMFENIEAICSGCGRENPLCSYDNNFMEHLEKFLSKTNTNVSEETVRNLFIDPKLRVQKLPMCCKRGLVAQITLSISKERPDFEGSAKKNSIHALPGPLSESKDSISWV